MKTILWLIQSNQITPTIVDFMTLFKNRMKSAIDIQFIVPETSKDIMDRMKDLNPTIFKIKNRTATKSHQGYLAKRNILGESRFSSGLSLTDTLLLDDLSGGNVIQTILEIEKPENTICLMLQIPTPLGSSENEERVYHAAITWAQQQGIPSIGYELLPLDTRWTLAPSLPDGVITRYEESFDHLQNQTTQNHHWQLPLYEAGIFSSVATMFNINGAKAAYHYRSSLKIPESRTILYLPHNVAMTYEYQDLIRILSNQGETIHLMIGVGKDQVRGAHTQEEIIKIVYKKELEKYASFSFHNMDSPWEMLLADSLVCCSSCFHSIIAQEKNIPSIIFDPFLPPTTNGFKQRVNQKDQLLGAVEAVITKKSKKFELATILMQIARSASDHV